LNEDDMFEPLPEHLSENVSNRLSEAWKREKEEAKAKNRMPSLTKAIRNVYSRRILMFGTLIFFEESIKVLRPLAMGRLIRYFRFDAPLSETDAYIAAFGIAITSALSALFHNPYFYSSQKIGMEVKIASIRLSSGAVHKTSVGNIINLFSIDVAKFDLCFLFIHYLWVSPLVLTAYIYLLWSEIGLSSFSGFLAIIILVPIQVIFQNFFFRNEIAVRTDKRVSIMNEILNGIRIIKMYAWEDAFASFIGVLRTKEMKKIRESYIWQSILMGTYFSSGQLVMLFAIITYLFTGHMLTAERIFVASALYDACRLPITLFVPFALRYLFETKISLRRIQEFLELEECEQLNEHENSNATMQYAAKSYFSQSHKEKNSIETGVLLTNFTKIDQQADVHIDDIQIEMEKFTAVWDLNEENDSVNMVYAVRDVTLKARAGQLIAIVGPVGCGKSSLLHSLLRETKCVSGKMRTNGRIAFVSQDAWIFSGSIRENILFGFPYEKERYEKTLQLCALNEDLAQMPNGDLSLVGDRGQSLSGGQKARVNLARAVYRDADIYLLDDPLSAVDATVGRHLFEKCITGFLKNKLVILVTHQLQYLQDAEYILFLRDGGVVAYGAVDEIKSMDMFVDFIRETEQSYKSVESDAKVDDSLPEKIDLPNRISEKEANIYENEDERSTLLTHRTDAPSINENEIINKSDVEKNKASNFEMANDSEDRVEGSVSWRIYGLYLKAMAHPLILLPLLFIFVVSVQIFSNFIDWWLKKWTNASEKSMELANASSILLLQGAKSESYVDVVNFGLFSSIVNLNLYRNIYAVMVAILVLVSVLKCIWFRSSQAVASNVLHDSMFKSVMKAKISFFDENPIGRILNRFSKDVGMMDDQLSFVFFEFLNGLITFIGIVCVILLINPIVFVPAIPLLFVFFFIRFFYLFSSRDVKRLEATTKSPLYSYISAVIQGLVTIRAFQSESVVMSNYYDHQDMNTAAFYLTVVTSRWFAVIIDWLVVFFAAVVAFACVFTPAIIGSGEVGLMLLYSIHCLGFFSWILRLSTETQFGVRNFLLLFSGLIIIARIVLSSSAVALLLVYAISIAAIFSRFVEIWTRCEINMVSIERIIQYCELPSEPVEEGVKPPIDWPLSGHLHFHNVSLRYNESSNPVLKNIEADILPKEKVYAQT
uniref:Multidrug resistance-associated protein lethal(2)03659 n=1 Tax=Dracunculus medinensis TaxID=318479 RepID=A0A158Q5Q4_DRAME